MSVCHLTVATSLFFIVAVCVRACVKRDMSTAGLARKVVLDDLKGWAKLRIANDLVGLSEDLRIAHDGSASTPEQRVTVARYRLMVALMTLEAAELELQVSTAASATETASCKPLHMKP